MLKKLNSLKQHVIDFESNLKRVEIDDDFDDEIYHEVFELNAMMQIIEERRIDDVCDVLREEVEKHNRDY